MEKEDKNETFLRIIKMMNRSNIFSLFFKTVNYIYKIITGEEIGSNTKKFLESIAYVSIGTIIANIFMLVAMVITIRVIGPVEYGTYGLILSIVNFILIPMNLGINISSSKYIAERRDKKKLISTSFYSVLFFTFVTITIALLLKNFFSSLIGIRDIAFVYAVVLGAGMAFYYIFESIFRGLQKIKLISYLRAIMCLFVTFVLLIFLFLLKEKTFISPTIALLLGYALYFIVGMFVVRKYISHFSGSGFKILMGFAVYVIFAEIAGVVLANISRFLINYYLNIYSVGIYSAYFFASNTIIAKFFEVLWIVFLPTVSAYKQKGVIFTKIGKISKKTFVVLFFGGIPITYILLKLFGKEYPLDFLLLLLFAFSSAIYFTSCLNIYLLASTDKSSMKEAAISLFFGAFSCVLFSILLIPPMKLYGAIIAVVIANLILLFVSNHYLKRRFSYYIN